MPTPLIDQLDKQVANNIHNVLLLKKRAEESKDGKGKIAELREKISADMAAIQYDGTAKDDKGAFVSQYAASVAGISTSNSAGIDLSALQQDLISHFSQATSRLLEGRALQRGTWASCLKQAESTITAAYEGKSLDTEKDSKLEEVRKLLSLKDDNQVLLAELKALNTRIENTKEQGKYAQMSLQAGFALKAANAKLRRLQGKPENINPQPLGDMSVGGYPPRSYMDGYYRLENEKGDDGPLIRINGGVATVHERSMWGGIKQSWAKLTKGREWEGRFHEAWSVAMEALAEEYDTLVISAGNASNLMRLIDIAKTKERFIELGPELIQCDKGGQPILDKDGNFVPTDKLLEIMDAKDKPQKVLDFLAGLRAYNAGIKNKLNTTIQSEIKDPIERENKIVEESAGKLNETKELIGELEKIAEGSSSKTPQEQEGLLEKATQYLEKEKETLAVVSDKSDKEKSISQYTDRDAAIKTLEGTLDSIKEKIELKKDAEESLNKMDEMITALDDVSNNRSMLTLEEQIDLLASVTEKLEEEVSVLVSHKESISTDSDFKKDIRYDEREKKLTELVDAMEFAKKESGIVEKLESADDTKQLRRMASVEQSKNDSMGRISELREELNPSSPRLGT